MTVYLAPRSSTGLVQRLVERPANPAATDLPPKDLVAAFDALRLKQRPHNKWWAYFENRASTPLPTTKIANLLQNLKINLRENWCGVTVGALTDRINIAGFTVPATHQQAIDDALSATQMLVEADDLHEAACVAGEAFLILWRTDDDAVAPPITGDAAPNPSDQIEAYFNDARQVHVFYDPAHPRRKRYAAKWFIDEQKYCHITLYYEDWIEYWISKTPADSNMQPTNFQRDMELGDNGIADNPYGVIPVFHFRRSSRQQSELRDVMDAQDGINMLLKNMIVAAEFDALRQKYIISQADVGNMPQLPGVIWELPAGEEGGQPTSVGQFEASQLENFLKPIDQLVNYTAIVTRVPRHYFYSTGDVPSGDALQVMEAPLVKKAKDSMLRFGMTWREVIVFLAMLLNLPALREIDVQTSWNPPETVQPKAQAETRQIDVKTGIPLVTALRDEGKSEAWITQMERDRDEERRRSAASLADALVAQQTRFDAGENPAAQPATRTGEAATSR